MRIVEEKPDIFGFPLLDPRFCAELIAASRGLPWKKAQVQAFSGKRGVLPYDRRCFDCTDEHLPLPERRRLRSYKKNVLDIASLCWQWRFTGYEVMQVVRYEPGGYFKLHFDYVPGNKAPARIVSFICYLNEGFSGGRTFFPRQKLTVEPKTGKALLFPSALTHPHRAEDVGGGERWALIGFLR